MPKMKLITFPIWCVQRMSSAFAPTKTMYVRTITLHELKSCLTIKKQLQYTTHDIRDGGDEDDVRMLQVDCFQFMSCPELVGL